MTCEHKDGWVMYGSPVIHTDQDNDNLEAEFECNNLNCKEKRTFKFEIVLRE